ncbi:25675_t:CDS:2, partial [Gigaspora rosea]
VTEGRFFTGFQQYGVTDHAKNGMKNQWERASNTKVVVKERAYIGWWQKLKILEGFISCPDQVHLKAGYIHRDLHLDNIG